jgi:5-methylcytosine-specific restriction endonuclease McrA
MKQCTKCYVQKQEDDFFVKDKKTGLLHAQCKQCYKQRRILTYKIHYKKYREQYLKRARIRRHEKRSEYREGMLKYLNGKQCVVCNESDPRVLEFDHIDPGDKSFNISQGVKLGYTWDEILLEIQKCQLLCANCHKKKTSEQFG